MITMKQPKLIMLFNGGNLAAFDENDEQIIELQKECWFSIYLDHLIAKGIDVTKVEFRIQGNSSPITNLRRLEDQGRWTWDVSYGI